MIVNSGSCNEFQLFDLDCNSIFDCKNEEEFLAGSFDNFMMNFDAKPSEKEFSQFMHKETASTCNDFATSETSENGKSEFLCTSSLTKSQDESTVDNKAKQEDDSTDYFKSLKSVLTNWLSEQVDLRSMENLSQFETTLATLIVEKKLSLKYSKLNHRPIEFLKMIMTSKITKSIKRVEENNKFIFKLIKKLLMKNFKAQNHLFNTKTALEKEFLAFYFNQNDLQNEILKVSKSSLAGRTTSIKIDTLSKAFQSKRFYDDFLKLLKNPIAGKSVLFAEYETIIQAKISTLFSKWNKKYEKNSEQCKKDMINYFCNNKKCKLPWSFQELKSSIVCLANSINLEIPSN